MSRELILGMSMSVDGFVCGPNGEIDWMFPTMSDAGRQWTADRLGQLGLIAMGRGVYPGMAAYWPTNTSPIASPMNEIPKAVFSRSGVVTPPDLGKDTGQTTAVESWLHPIVAGKDLVADMQRLKAEDGKPIGAIGGAAFGASLIAANLVDEFRLVVHPIALGRGVPLFGEVASPLRLKLVDLVQFETGAVAKMYRPLQR